MSVRGVGEGHISRIGFRNGVPGSAHDIHFDEPGNDVITGRTTAGCMSRDFLRAALAERPDAALADHILSLLPDPFNATDLESALACNNRDRPTRASSDAVSTRIRWIASCNYEIEFPSDRPLGEHVIYPTSPDESHGIEDARFSLFQDDNGTISYYATCTVLGGTHVPPAAPHPRFHLVPHHEAPRCSSAEQGNDDVPAGRPRPLPLALTLRPGEHRDSWLSGYAQMDRRHYRRNTQSSMGTHPARQLHQPPIETNDGWLVLTHGVGPVHEYAIGAILLDIDDPTIVLGALNEPILSPEGEERDEYVPNVNYSCGALVHGQTLVLPYGCSDSSIKVAYLDLGELLQKLHKSS